LNRNSKYRSLLNECDQGIIIFCDPDIQGVKYELIALVNKGNLKLEFNGSDVMKKYKFDIETELKTLSDCNFWNLETVVCPAFDGEDYLVLAKCDGNGFKELVLSSPEYSDVKNIRTLGEWLNKVIYNFV